MFLLLSFGLVVAAAVLFGIGVMGGELVNVYLSMACSGAAGLALMVSARLGRPKVEAAPEGPAPLEQAPPSPRREHRADREPEPAPAPEPQPAMAAAAPAQAPASAPAPVVDDWDDDGDDVVFPIADYDDLTEDEVLPLLPELDDEELDLVEERERLTKVRPGVLDRIDELRGGR